MTKIEEWAREQPFTLSVIIILIIVIPGFFSFQATLDKAEEAIDRAEASAVEAQAVAAKNKQVVECVITWVRKNTDALQDRDVVNKTKTGAEDEMWEELYEFLAAVPPITSRDPMLSAIDHYRDILQRLQKQDIIDPYPEIKSCLRKPVPVGFFELVSLHPGHPCWGRSVTIRGTYQDDVLRGTDGPDVIIGLKGDDLIFAGNGNDRICGDLGDDTINGGAGFDRGRGGRGDDFCIQTEREKGC